MDRKIEKIAGRTATWKPKNRESVAPVTSSPPRRKYMTARPRSHDPCDIGPTFVAKYANSFQGSK